MIALLQKVNRFLTHQVMNQIFFNIILLGHTEPDPSKDTTLKIDGKIVTVPQGKVIQTSFKNSYFSQSEYLIYKESQNRIRYLLKMKF